MKSDMQLKRDIEEELAWDPAVNEVEIGVEVTDGVVTLSGHLRNYGQKYAAGRAAQRVSGVKGLAVEIDVRVPGESAHSDTDLARAALQILEWNSQVPKNKICVMVENGWLTLSGQVDYQFQRFAAEKGLRHLDGAVGMMNNITIKPATVDKDIKEKIEAALQRRAHLETQAIQVKVEDSEITLTGTVPSLPERNAAIAAATHAPGVTRVIDHLKIA